MGLLDTPGIPGSEWYKYMADPRSINPNIGQKFPSTKKVKGAGLFERLGQTLLPDPSNAEGLLSSEDIAHARSQGLLGIGQGLLAASGPTDAAHKVGFMQAVGQGLQGGQEAYRGALDTAAAYQKTAQDMQTGKLGNQAKQIELDQTKKRQEILAALPPPDQSAGSGAMLKWIDQAVPALTQAGLTEDATQLAQMRKSLERDKLQAVQAGDAVYTFDPNTGQYTKGPERHMNPDQKRLADLKLAEQAARTHAMQGVADNTLHKSLTNEFWTRNKDLATRTATLNQGLITLNQARTDPVLTSSALANFVQSADQKLNLRYQMLNYFRQNIDPSFTGKWEVLYERMTKGKLPPRVIDSMVTHLQRLRDAAKEEWDTRRSGEIKRHPALEGWLAPGEEVMRPYSGEGTGVGLDGIPPDSSSDDDMWNQAGQ